jgi:hypothetical protein
MAWNLAVLSSLNDLVYSWWKASDFFYNDGEEFDLYLYL